MTLPPLTAGEPAPWFVGRTALNPNFNFESAAGRKVVLAFLGSAANPASRDFLAGLSSIRDRFDDVTTCFFGVSIDPGDERLGLIADDIPGIRFFMDDNREISRAYRALGEQGVYRLLVYILDAQLRVVAALPIGADAGECIAHLRHELDALPATGEPWPATAQAPVLVVPRVFEPALCRTLVETYEQGGGEDSGFMRDVKGKTTLIIDYGHKRRRDCTIKDEKLRNACMVRIHDRLAPEIHKAYQFRATRIERHIVACYDAGEGGHFRAHRDNTTLGTAHRRFAVSLFLNSGEYDGGFLRFPEYGPALFSAPTGGAVVFSCSLQHEATPVTRGRRYMYLPFLYDEEAKRLREENKQYLDERLTGAGDTTEK
ncbi:MAG: 2OG-Fe(II) oxygenase [Gammaproteobacteria bacterium]|nr:2OG-Fe(II) oxygenase [Gammaproteobacteria bacterium]